MNRFIDFKIMERERREMNGYELIGSGDMGFNFNFHNEETNKCKTSNTPLTSEILETANYFFQKKGFEKTTLSDICDKLSINNSQFYKYFESLDEVLEILWAK